MSLFKRARRHIDMRRVKELCEEKIKRKKIAELIKHRQEIIAELQKIELEELKHVEKHVDWKKEIEEGMNTNSIQSETLPGLGPINLGPAMPDVTLSGSSNIGWNSITKSTLGNRSKYDTLVVTVVSSSSEWEIVRGDAIVTLGSGGAGNSTVVIPRTYSSLYFTARDNGSVRFSVQYQRRNAVQAVVSLNDPNASALIRGGLGGNEQRKAQLKDQMEAANQLMVEMGLDPSTTSPGDIEIAQTDPRGPMPEYVRDSIKRQYKGGPDYKLEDMKNIINWNKKKTA